MKINDYLKEFPEYLRGVRDAADNTVADYMHDVNRYLDYFREKVDPSLDSFELDANHIRGFVTFLRMAGNENSTVERRLHDFSLSSFQNDRVSDPGNLEFEIPVSTFKISTNSCSQFAWLSRASSR